MLGQCQARQIKIRYEKRADQAANDPSESSRGAHNYPSPNAALTRTQAAANQYPQPSRPPNAMPMASPSLPPLHPPQPPPLKTPTKDITEPPPPHNAPLRKLTFPAKSARALAPRRALLAAVSAASAPPSGLATWRNGTILLVSPQRCQECESHKGAGWERTCACARGTLAGRNALSSTSSAKGDPLGYACGVTGTNPYS